MFKTLKTFYGFLTKKKLAFILFIFLLVLASLLSSITPYFLKILVQEVQKSNFSGVTNNLLIFILVLFSGLVIAVISQFVGDFLAIDASVDVRTSVFKRLQDLDFAFHTSKSTGSIISAIKRGDGAFFTFQHVLHFVVLEIIVRFLVMIYFFSMIDLRIVFMVIVSTMIAFIVSRLIISLNIKFRTRLNDEEDKVSGIIVDNTINYDTVKLFAKENWEVARLTRAFIPWKNALWKYANTFRLLNISMGAIVNTSFFMVLYLGLNMVYRQKIEIADFVLVLTFVSSFYPQLWDLIYSVRDVAKNYADILKYFEILDYGIEIKDPVKPVKLNKVKGDIEYRDVSFSYKEGKRNAVNNINLKIKAGQSIAFVGRSGSGKTTLIRLLLRFYDVNLGQISIDGINIQDFTKSQLRGFTGVVPQEPILFNDTVGYNIGYGKIGATLEEIKRAAKMANIDRFIESLPKKYETYVGERGVKLSGGQKQRLAIARMILSDPNIIIFDEATSQLDSESESLIQKALWQVARDKTTIIIAHRLSTAMRADKIAVLENGRIVEEDSHQELLSREDSLYKHFWDLQTNIDN